MGLHHVLVPASRMSAWLCSTHVELDDLQLFLPEQQARDAMEAFDGDADGHISAEVAVLTTSSQPSARGHSVAST